MFKEVDQAKVAWLAGFSVFLITVVVTPATTLDPINLPKLWVLTAIGFAAGFLLLGNFKNTFQKSNLFIISGILGTPFFMILGIFFSNSNLTRELFGTYGRNSGLFTYLSLSLLALAISIASSAKIRKPFLLGAVGALGVNVIYVFIQAIGKDPQKWANSYSPVFGTLGNPDFASAFLGFGAAFAIAYLFSKDSNLKIKLLCILFLLLATFDIYKSQAQQGIIVLLTVLVLVLFFEIRNYFKSKVFQSLFLLFVSVSIFLTIAGSLQKGPLADLIYRPSITQRGDYWHAGIKMIFNNPIFGVGLDSYGEWYRFYRSPEAAARFEGSVVANTAHNVFIDIGSTAGLPAIIAYLLFIFVAMKSAWYYLKSNQYLDPFFIGVFAAWLGYLAQSVISINNLALGIWGWVLPGLLIAMPRWTSESNSNLKSVTKSKKKSADFSTMWMYGGLTVGAIIGFIPFNSDANFRHSLETGNPEKIYLAAKKWPTDTPRLIYAAKLFESNKLESKAIELARYASAQYPRNFEAWQFIYTSPLVSENEKREAIYQLKKLDPNNKNLKP